jgi:hypothetical protein
MITNESTTVIITTGCDLGLAYINLILSEPAITRLLITFKSFTCKQSNFLGQMHHTNHK